MDKIKEENYKKPKATLLHASPLSIGEIAGRICYDSFSLSEHELVRNFEENPKEFINNLSTLGDIESSKLLDKLFNVYFHESVAEHINLTYHVERVSREIIIEWNRTRIGMPTSQKSTRYTIEDLVNAFVDWYDNSNGAIGEEHYNAFEKVVDDNIVHKNNTRVTITTNYLLDMLSTYHEEEPLKKGLTGGAKKKQNDRVKRCLPESWMLEGIWTFNLRSLKHFVNLRSSGSAYYGIREVVETVMEQTPHKYRILVDKKYKELLLKQNKGEINE